MKAEIREGTLKSLKEFMDGTHDVAAQTQEEWNKLKLLATHVCLQLDTDIKLSEIEAIQ